MNIKNIISISGLVIFLAISGTLFFIVPEEHWQTKSYLGLALFSISFSFPFFTPFLNITKENNDAGFIAGIGILYAIFIFILIFSSVTFYYSFTDNDRFFYASAIFTVGLYSAFLLIYKSSIKLIEDVSDKNASAGYRTIWCSMLLSQAPLIENPHMKATIENLYEIIVYAPSDVEGVLPLNKEISTQINELVNSLDSKSVDKFNTYAKKIESLLSERKFIINAKRSKI